MPPNKDSRRRHSKQSSSQSKTLSPPSTLSVLSTSTSGSNSTVTPDRPPRPRRSSIITTERSFRSGFRQSRPKKPVAKEPVPTKDVQAESSENHSDRENLDLFPSKRIESNYSAPKVFVPEEPVPTEEIPRGSSENHSDGENLDVFAFMVKDGQEVDSDANEDLAEEEEEDSEEDYAKEDHTASVVDEDASTTSTAPDVELSLPQASSPSNLEVTAAAGDGQNVWQKGMARAASLHSDSGISVRSSSPERDSSSSRHKTPYVRKVSSSGEVLPQAAAYPNYYAAPTAPETYGTYGTYGSRSSGYPRDWSTYQNAMENPEAYYASTRPVVTQTIQRPPRVPLPDDHKRRSHQLVRGPPHPQPEKVKSKKSGYDTLAAAIDSRGDAFLKPIYRKFETLNHRILLYLQDEISEMEEELRELDLAISKEDGMLGKKHASRRAEAKLPSPLQWRRLELLSRSYTKVEQYSEPAFLIETSIIVDLTLLLDRALSSYSSLTQSLEPASQADINTYQEWITEHAPIAEQETVFLRREADLIAVSPQKKKSRSIINSNIRSEIDNPALIVAFTLISALIVFKFVPQILARLIISLVFGVASLYTIAPSVFSDVKIIRNWTGSISMYVSRLYDLEWRY